MSGDICTDDRFELIAKAKAKLLECTNIESRQDEIAVLDSILFRCWQMGWLDQLHASSGPLDVLLRCLENDWNISASWDGLRKFWCIELTEEGVRLRDAELNSRAERTCKFEFSLSRNGWADHTCTNCGYTRNTDIHVYLDYNYCPNCGCKVIGGDE